MTPHFEPAVFEAACGAEREALVAHAAGCAPCRAQLAAADPALLFALLRARPIPARVLDEVSSQGARQLPTQRPSWIEALRLRGASRGAAAAAVLARAIAGATVVVQNARKPLPVPAAVAAAPLAGISVLQWPGPARVVDLTVGDTQVVMIFDPEMKL
jgi:hypothetical protein